MSNIEKHSAFIDSLEGEKGLPEEMHGFAFSSPLQRLEEKCFSGTEFTQYLIERVRRAESRQIPDLKERVKELMRDAMQAVRRRYVFDEEEARDAFFALCKPEKDSKEVKP